MGEMADFITENNEVSIWEGECGPPSYIKCKFCSRSGFVWGRDGDNGWRLFTENGSLHKCGKNPTQRKESE